MAQKHRLVVIFSAALIVLASQPDLGAQSGKLASLNRVGINVEEFGREERKLGLATDDIKAHVIDQLRSKIPRLVIEESASEFIYIVILLGTTEGDIGGNPSFAGSVLAEVYRRVRVHATGTDVAAVVWRDLRVVQGRLDAVLLQVHEALDVIVGKLAANWYKDNP